MSRSEAAAKRYDPECRDCPRLAQFLDSVKAEHPLYHAKPVAPFGDARARLLIVGLAPGMHGANRTGRPFTGDYAGILLYRTLHRFGFASAEQSTDANDALSLNGCRITNAVKCLPPANKPEPAEIRCCNRYLKQEIATLPKASAILALGTIAHRAVLMTQGSKPAAFPFTHGAVHALSPQLHLFDSYHCSRYNTQTRRLDTAMFEAVFEAIVRYMKNAHAPRVRPY